MRPKWVKVPLDFGPWPGIVVTWVRVVDVLSAAWGTSTSEVRREIERGAVTTGDFVYRAGQVKPVVRAVGFEPEIVEPGTVWRIGSHAIEFERRPVGWLRSLWGSWLQWWCYGYWRWRRV